MTEKAAVKEKVQSKSGPIKMIRDPEIYPAPHTVDVHPDEVENYKQGGWELA